MRQSNRFQYNQKLFLELARSPVINVPSIRVPSHPRTSLVDTIPDMAPRVTNTSSVHPGKRPFLLFFSFSIPLLQVDITFSRTRSCFQNKNYFQNQKLKLVLCLLNLKKCFTPRVKLHETSIGIFIPLRNAQISSDAT